MVKERERVIIEIEPNGELAQALRSADERAVVLVSDGTCYEVVRVDRDTTDDDDAEAFRAALRAAVGIFTPEEAERLKQNIYRWREEGTRPTDHGHLASREESARYRLVARRHWRRRWRRARSKWCVLTAWA